MSEGNYKVAYLVTYYTVDYLVAHYKVGYVVAYFKVVIPESQVNLKQVLQRT